MPIKTIQPFVSNFNAFAGEGFYGNVVQGLVIKQLEDAVFIFGIAIDGTLIFRKRNYPDVSTWEDPKIIIHSNNWHKIYFVTDLGELVNDTYESFSLESGVETQIAYGTGAYYICGPVSDTLSCIAVVNYYSVATLGVVGGLTFRVTERTLYATSDGSSDIRVKKIRTNS